VRGVRDIVLGLLALLAGVVFLTSGERAFRLAIPIWGAFVGFSAGAGIVSWLSGDALLAKPFGWILGFVLALVFATFAYLYYWVAVVLAFSSFGFLVGSTLMTALGIRWNWLVALVGVVVGAVFAWFAISSNLPKVMLVVLSAVAGATAVVGGLMLLFDDLDSADLNRANVVDRIDDGVGWWVLYVVLLVGSIVAQMVRRADEERYASAWD